MKVKELIKTLEGLNPNWNIVMCSDEEGNTAYNIHEISPTGKCEYCIWPGERLDD